MRKSRHHRLVPVTAGKAITLAEYIEQESRSRVVDVQRLRPEWISYYDRVKRKIKG